MNPDGYINEKLIKWPTRYRVRSIFFMSSQDIDKAYVSPYDAFLFRFDHNHDKSASQIKEIKKHERIALLRDNKELVSGEEKIWEEF